MSTATRQPGARRATRAPRVPFALLVTALILGGLVLLLGLNTASAANELKRRDLAARDQRVAAQVQQLRNQVALSAAPGNLARAAAELGMVPAGNPAFIVLGPDGSAKVLGKAKAVVGVPQPIAPAPTTPHKAKASKTASKTPATSTSAHSTKTPKTSKTPAGGRHRSTSAKPSTSTSRATSSSTPTSTPTPTLTLPGGHR
ncbi:hypothetical protein [uncultured Jatrophihabitans sp.]|uniref:hypothetical protein n=1 Tax=uncultured Jatrophihabitans sp. TaxID=1610747 RepID=UPI0035C96493